MIFPRSTLLAVILTAVLAVPAFAGPADPHLLTVSGEGTMKAAPDRAELSAGVVTLAPTAATALAQNSLAMNAVFAKLKSAGIPDKSIQTSDFSVSAQYQTYKTGSGSVLQHIVGYQVSNNVEVTVDDPAKVGPTIDALVSSGANQLGNISFSIADPKPLLTQAREAAVKDAIERAQTYAKAAGVSLGPIVSIQEGGSEAPRPMMRMMAGMVASSAPIAGGEESVSANVSISWEIH
jgi:uncharacterized protein YggE